MRIRLTHHLHIDRRVRRRQFLWQVPRQLISAHANAAPGWLSPPRQPPAAPAAPARQPPRTPTARSGATPDGKMLASQFSDAKHGHLWNVSTGKEIRKFPQSGIDIAMSPNGQFLALTRGPNELHLWEVDSGKLAYTRMTTRADTAAFPPAEFC